MPVWPTGECIRLCDAGAAAGDLVTVPLDRTNLPPKFIRRPALALDEQTETAWWVGVRYGPCAVLEAPPGRRAVALRAHAATSAPERLTALTYLEPAVRLVPVRRCAVRRS